MQNEKWVLCPVCGNKTRIKIRENTVLLNFPLFCPKCRQEQLINVQQLKVTIIKEPDAQTQSRWICEVTCSSLALSLYRIGWISPPNKKNGAFGGRIYHALIKTYLPSKPVLSLEGFLCVGQIQPRCLSEAAAIYIVSRTSEDNLLKKALLARGTFLLSK